MTIVFSGMLLNGYSQSFKLEYKYPAVRAIKYVTNTKIVTENVKLEIKIDSLSLNVESPQGAAGGERSE